MDLHGVHRPVMLGAMAWYCARCGTRATAPGACARDGQSYAPVEGVLGRVAGNYTLVGQVGEGGMGEVFRAINPTIDAEVAVKVLHATTNTGRDASRFLVEARAVNRVKHDGVAKILDAGYLDIGRPYLVMELLDGESLATALHRQPLELARAVQIASDVLGVVATAHAADIVHRDLKPQNVFLTRSGRTVVLDFGVAKLLDNSTTITRTGAMVGTPGYMAPEQIHAGEVDARTDVYAVGVMLYEMVVGARPFDGASAFEVAQAHVNAPVPRLPAGMPGALQKVIDTALAKRPSDRYPTADAMRTALASVQLTKVAARSGGGAKRFILVAGAIVVGGGVATAIALSRGGTTASPASAPIDAIVAKVPAPRPIDAAAADAQPSGVDAGRAVAQADIDRIESATKLTLVRRSLIVADLPTNLRVDYVRAKQAGDLELMTAAADRLLDAAEHLEIDARFLEKKLAFVTKTYNDHKGQEPLNFHPTDVRLREITRDLANGDLELANRRLTEVFNEISKWPPKPKPRTDDLMEPGSLKKRPPDRTDTGLERPD
jgi:hypothetical protein